MKVRVRGAWVGAALFGVLASSGVAGVGAQQTGKEGAVSNANVGGLPLVLEGSVFGSDGAPAEGAVVVTTAGGRAVTDAAGRYRIELELAPGVEELRVSAFGPRGSNQRASTPIVPSSGKGTSAVNALVLAPIGGCQPSWLPTFGGRPGTDRAVRAFATFDEGSGPVVFAGGDFSIAGSVVTSAIAKWTGSTWAALSQPITGGVNALAVFDDGGGPALFVGGWITLPGAGAATGLARWDGSTWTAYGVNGQVECLEVLDDGNGPALFVGGSFTRVGPMNAKRIARFDGTAWTTFSSGLNGTATSLALYDDGGGPALIVAGGFSNAGGVSASRVARWDGASWSSLGSGVNSTVNAVAAHDDGSGPALFAAGNFTSAGGVAASRIARWNGSGWSALGTGLAGGGSFPTVNVLEVFDDGSGPVLVAGGNFATAGGEPARRLARWDGSGWDALDSGASGVVHALAVVDDGGGPELHIGGEFTSIASLPVDNVAKWDGSTWESLGSGLNDNVYVTAVLDDGSGPQLFVGGSFGTTGTMDASWIAKWNGSSWSSLGSGVNGIPYDMLVFDDGSGPAIYVTGTFTSAGGVFGTWWIARWDGTSWTPVPNGFNAGGLALEVFDDGTGPALYLGGSFSYANGGTANNLAKWDGTSWTDLGATLQGGVYDLVVYDDGSGPALYMGGGLFDANSKNPLLKWDGSTLTPIGIAPDNYTFDMLVHDDGSGPKLFVAGLFAEIGALQADGIATWDGTSWASVGGGLGQFGISQALTAFDDGSGSQLYVGGRFTSAGGIAANNVARWNGTTWEPLSSGMSHTVATLSVFDDGGGSALFLGGYGNSFESGDSFLAKWGCGDSLAPQLSCPGSVSVIDRLGSPPGEVVFFSVTASDDQDPSPSVVSVPPSGSFFPAGTTIVTSTATDASGNESTCQFPVEVRPKTSSRAR